MLVESPSTQKPGIIPPPQDAQNLFEMFEYTAKNHPARGMYVLDERGGQEFRTYAQILEASLRVGAALQHHNIKPEQRIFLSQSTGFEFLTSLFGALAIGAVPIPLPVPRTDAPTVNKISVAARWTRISKRLDTHAALFSSGVDSSLRPKVFPGSAFQLVADLPKLLENSSISANSKPLRAARTDLAYIQLTSGTTTARRGVMLTHHNILQNVQTVGELLKVNDKDVVVSWLPIDNIMGLVAVVFFSIYWGIDAVLIEPDRFLKQPADWLTAISNHRGTLTLAPNYAYHYCARRCKNSDLEGLDLSSWRVALNGAEPVRAQHMEVFSRRFRPYGLRKNIFVPVYGLSEATMAVSMAPPEQPLVIDGINRAVLEFQGIAQPLPPTGAPTPAERMHIVSIGRPLAGIELAIFDDQQNPVADRVCGEIALRGDNVMTDYVAATINTDDRRPGLTRLKDGWLFTGDVGYLADGNLFFIGRRTEAILTPNGRHIYPEEVELFVNSIDGIRSGTATIFDVPGNALAENSPDSPNSEDSQLVIAYETQSGVDTDEVDTALRTLLKHHLALEPDILIALSPRSIPKTRSGKVRRFLARQLFLDQKLDRRHRNAFDLFTVVRGLRKFRRDAARTTQSTVDYIHSLFKRSTDD